MTHHINGLSRKQAESLSHLAAEGKRVFCIQKALSYWGLRMRRMSLTDWDKMAGYGGWSRCACKARGVYAASSGGGVSAGLA